MAQNNDDFDYDKDYRVRYTGLGSFLGSIKDNPGQVAADKNQQCSPNIPRGIDQNEYLKGKEDIFLHNPKLSMVYNFIF